MVSGTIQLLLMANYRLCYLCAMPYDLEHAIWHFEPHLSVGQARGMGNMFKLLQDLQAGWRPIRFRVDSVQLIWRDNPPDDTFRVDRSLPLQGR